MILDDLLTLNAWITSDQHWEHPRIREYQQRPENHFWLMRNRWSERVRENDVLLHLGDLVCFGNRKKHPMWVSGLPGNKLLILGNHDYHEPSWYEAFGFQVIGRGDRPYWWVAPSGVVVAFSHEPLTDPGHDGWDVNIHGHIHGNTHRSWEQRPHGAYRNVSVEVTNYSPVRLGDVLMKGESE